MNMIIFLEKGEIEINMLIEFCSKKLIKLFFFFNITLSIPCLFHEMAFISGSSY